jgi:CheY-like chemotaxis protein
MALRVLLADESSTIKKVMQLALSDFGVEVKSVPVGLDVLQVAKTFQPDIVFADVLLSKRSGYDVSADLKRDPETTKIPVVLMWSGFMEIDEVKARESRADRRLEKPFDADHLRGLVTDLVPKTTANPISKFVSFPEMPEFEETPAQKTAGNSASVSASTSSSPARPTTAPASEENNSHDDFVVDDSTRAGASPLDLPEEEFSAVPLTTPKMNEEHDEGGWSHQDLTKFKIQIPDENANDFAAKFVIPQDDDLTSSHIETAGNFEEISFEEASGPDLTAPTSQPSSSSSAMKTSAAAPAIEPMNVKIEKSVKDQMMETLTKGQAASAAQPKTQSKGDISPDMMEKIIREEAREVIESICWKLLPEIAERVVREEMNKILRDQESY